MKTLLILIGLCSLSCSLNNDKDKTAKVIADNYCNCKEKIFSSDDNIVNKKIKFEDCAYDLFRAVENISEDSIYKEALYHLILQIIEDKCSDSEIKKLFNEKTQISNNLKNKPNQCKEYFKDGDYIFVGVEEPMIITRKGLKNYVKYSNSGCETVSDILWIDDCQYYLILRKSNCPMFVGSIGDSLLVRVISIINDTINYEIDYEIENEVKTFPGIMKRVNN